MNYSYFVNFATGLLPDKSTYQDILFLRLALAAFAALIVAYIINRIITKSLPRIANMIAARGQPGGRLKAADKLLARRRVETLLSIAAGVGRLMVTVLCLYVAWIIVNPTRTPVALIGASAFFIVLGAATIGPLLKDLTSGILMISEKWYNVGDHVVVDPFWELSGVVEKVNLRSTRLRSLSGEVIWIHNQYIQAVRVSSTGVRTLSVDTFVKDLDKGRHLINGVLKTMPIGPTMIVKPPVISYEEKLENNWRITLQGETAPGREWLIEDFLLEAIKKADQEADQAVIVQGPIVRYTDSDAEIRFARSMGRTILKNK